MALFNFFSPSGELAFQFALLNDLKQIVSYPTRIPNRLGDRSNILDLFLTTTPPNIQFPFPLPWAPPIIALFLLPLLLLRYIMKILRVKGACGILPMPTGSL